MLYAAAVWLSAFLLFQIQPIAAGILLPWFGGSAAIWTTCLLFFQGALVIGYGYAAWVDRRLSPRAQFRVHATLLAIGMAWLPAVFLIDWKPDPATEPIAAILAVLTATIGLPYFLLSSTGPLLQSWYRTTGRGSPYRLYSLSNAGSLLALVTYPFLVEPFLSRRTQAVTWAVGYGIYAMLCGWIAFRRKSAADSVGLRARSEVPPPAWTQYAWWLSLAACASLLLVATTSYLSQNLAPVPFLWVLPLALYLVTFVITFGHERLYWRWIWMPLAAISAVVMAYELIGGGDVPDLSITIAIFSAGLFICALFCHGELARAKPDASWLTSFYVASASGGAAASLFAGVIAPRVFRGNDELPIALVGVGTIAAITFARALSRWTPRRIVRVLLVTPAVAAVLAGAWYVRRGVLDGRSNSRVAVRNFYGALRVADVDAGTSHFRQLIHGTIIHSAQHRDAVHRCDPITYYAPVSGVGVLLSHWHVPFPRIGVMGLGSGTLAGFGHSGDYYRFYEINPLVIGLARREFSFLECGAAVDVVQGDARLSMEREPTQRFDLLVMDAFSGDSIPLHLLTREAFEIYFRHLKSSGVLAVHISNRYIDLRPVVLTLAQRFGKQVLVFDTAGDDDEMIYSSQWMLIADRGGILSEPEIAAAGDDISDDPSAAPLWTDDYASIWRALKWRAAP